MDINRENMQEFFTSLETRFAAGMERVRTPRAGYVTLADIGTSAPVKGAAVTHGWLTQLPGMRKWVGDRIVENLASGKLTVANDSFESTIEVPRNDVEDDNYGVYGNLSQAMGGASEELWLDLGITALLNNAVWVDGKPFFAADRKYDKVTINNKGTDALARDKFEAAVVAMMSYRGAGNRPLQVRPVKLLVGPSLRATAFEICQAARVIVTTGTDAAAVDNPNAGLVAPVVSPALVGEHASKWFLIGEVNGILPVFIQKRKEAVFVAKDSLTDDNVFHQNRFLYGTDARGAGLLTLPHLCYAGGLS